MTEILNSKLHVLAVTPAKAGVQSEKMDSRLRGNDKHCFRNFAFFTFTFLLAALGLRLKSSASIIERTCAFDAKIYKIVDGIVNVSACGGWNNKIFKLFYFCFQLPSLLVENKHKYSCFKSFFYEHRCSENGIICISNSV